MIGAYSSFNFPMANIRPLHGTMSRSTSHRFLEIF